MESGEKNVSQLVAATGLSPSNVSRHRLTLTTDGIRFRRKEKMSVYYALADRSICNIYKRIFIGWQKRSSKQARMVGPQV
jgi:DNA-binding transcriptional ArsR family regulator